MTFREISPAEEPVEDAGVSAAEREKYLQHNRLATQRALRLFFVTCIVLAVLLAAIAYGIR